MKRQHRLHALIIGAALSLIQALPAAAQWIPCHPEGEDLVKIPELISKDGKLRGTIVLSDTNQRFTFRQPPSQVPGAPGTTIKCAPQLVRYFRGLNTTPPYPAKEGDYPDPLPGPTLRARVGDLVELTFLNQINPADFGDSIDRGEEKTGTGCDETNGIYPKSSDGKINDTYPDCFHGSSTANIHFHGTHTNPNSTGDNVFIEVRPSPRKDKRPVVTESTFADSFSRFFANCEAKLKVDQPLVQWPYTWKDLPATYTARQKELLQDYDKNTNVKPLWPIDREQLRVGNWPQYYIGAFPYCFRLPEYKEAEYPPPAPAPTPHTGGPHMEGRPHSGMPVRVLQMGQSPGTHWYHAHKHGSTAINVGNGMTGVFIIEGKYDDDLNAKYGKDWTRSQPVIVINQLGVTPNLERAGGNARTDKGPNFSVNGRMNPTIHMQPGEVQMWRIVNTSGRGGAFFVGPPAGFHWKQLAQDGVQFNNDNYNASLDQPFLLAAGNRGDFLVQAPSTAPAAPTPVLVQIEVDPQDLSSANQVPLMTVKVGGDAKSMDFISPAPKQPPFLEKDIKASDVKGTKVVTFSSTGPGKGGVHKINGKQFDGEVGEVVLLNQVEEWKIVNETYGPPISHPFHIHINPFQIVEVFDPNATMTDPATGKPVSVYVFDAPATVTGQCSIKTTDPSTWHPCTAAPAGAQQVWWDTFPIPSGKAVGPVKIPGYFKMRSRFVDYTGFYVLHCHILAHEDRGMMTVVEVVPLETPYVHD
jgi:FtsP/CotA-like multicopper oxidase with cupredoxin domain